MSSRRPWQAIAFALLVVGVVVWNASIAQEEEPLTMGASSRSSSSLLSLSEEMHTKRISLVKKKSMEIESMRRLPGNFPPLSSLIEAVSVEPEHKQQLPLPATIQEGSSQQSQQQAVVKTRIIGDVKFLLDYAIVGFSKCGTTTLLKWLRRDPDVRTFKREIFEIVDNDPGSLVERLYENLLEQPVNTTTARREGHSHSKPFLQGFKNPEILQVPLALRHIHTYWPETKLIITARNPLKWFRSFYNFRLTLGHLQQVGKDPNALIGGCSNNSKDGQRLLLCSHMGAFHAKLVRLGKTDMSSPEEWELLKPYLSSSEDIDGDDQDIWHQIRKSGEASAEFGIPRMKNKIFFLDLRQMSDSNRTRSKVFRKDLQSFLGLQHELSPVFRARPFKQLELTQDEESKQHKIESICDPRFLPLQQELYPMAQKASLWIRQYFLKSPDVFVSSPEYLEELLETWMENPCG